MLKLVETILEPKPADPAQNDYHRALVLPSRKQLLGHTSVPHELTSFAPALAEQLPTSSTAPMCRLLRTSTQQQAYITK